MSAHLLRFLFDFNHAAITRNCGGVTHEESLEAPEPAGNSANWVLGHIVANRTSVLNLLGETPLWTEADIAPYARGTHGIEAAAARAFDSMLQDLETTQTRIRAGIDRLTPEAFGAKAKPEDKNTRGEQLFFHQFHEAYHAGQLGLLRRLAGKAGAI
jgi:uncharacterized damage-inducible protein DinB